jgi:CRISPR-associated endonuclease Csn1
MAELSLGLDIGCGSIGWALVDEAGSKVFATGARVFPEGVDRDQQGGEKSKGQARRSARLMRRQLARRAARKRQLRQLLISIGLLPTDPIQFQELLATSPYVLRRRALDARLEPFEIGRVLLNLNQRRGFLSTRKTNQDGDAETKGMLREIGELAGAIQAAGCRTLGEYLATVDQTSITKDQHSQKKFVRAIRAAR